MIALLLFFASAAPTSTLPPAVDRAWTMLKMNVAAPSTTTRLSAVHALGISGIPTEYLAEKALTDQDKHVRIEAAAALLQMHAVGAKPKLHACLKDQDIQVVMACANTLYEFKDPAAYEIYYSVLTGERRSHESLMQSQLDMLKDRKQVEKLAFEAGIGFIPYGGMAWQAIQTITHNDGASVLALSALRLANDPNPSTGKALAKYALDKRAGVREAAVQAIAKRGDVSLINTAEILLADDNENVRDDAAAAIIALSSRTKSRHLFGH
jgi:HEAT repeat protein